MLYTIIVNKKIIVDVENSNKLEDLIHKGIEAINMSGTIVAEDEEIYCARSTRYSEKIWLKNNKERRKKDET